MSRIIDKIKEVLGIVSNHKVATHKECLSAFIDAIEQCDIDEDGLINVKELLKLYKDMTLKTFFVTQYTDEYIKKWLDNFLQRV